MKFAESMIYAEDEGLLPTRLGKINAVINAVKEYPHYEIEFSEFEKILEQHGLKYKELSNQEIQYINDSLN